MILVFGKTGQLATALSKDPDVVCLGRDQADLCDPEACAAQIRTSDARAIINAAAFTDVDGAETRTDLAHLINASAPTAMARAAAARGLPFVHVSTDYVFDGSGQTPWTESDPPAPTTAYGHSKLAGEQGIIAAGGLYAILRTAWVFSATGRNFLNTMLRLSDSHEVLRIVNDQHGGPTPAEDLARACLHVARNLTPDTSGLYHYAGAPDTTWAAFAAKIFALSGKATKIVGIASSDYPTPAVRPLNSVLDCRKIHASFGLAQPQWQAALGYILSSLKDRS